MEPSSHFVSQVAAASLLIGALLSGCGGKEEISSTSLLVPLGDGSTISRNASWTDAGGQFTAAYTGTSSYHSCINEDKQGYDKFSGTGSATFVHASVESVESLKAVTHEEGFFNCPVVSFTGSLKSKQHPGNAIFVSITNRSDPLCATDEFSITGGSGKFAHATGSGSVTFVCSGSYSYTDQWSGSISF